MNLITAAFALPAVLFTMSFSGVTNAADVVVLRGNSAETVRTTSDVTVLRGGGTMRAMPTKAVPKSRPARVVAGRTLWVVDDDGRPTVACYLVYTSYVGGRKIRCTSQTY